jgi:hypothetical protein
LLRIYLKKKVIMPLTADQKYYRSHRAAVKKRAKRYYWANREKIIAKAQADRDLLKQLKREKGLLK